MLPCLQHVLLYGLKTLYSVEHMRAIPAWLFSDEALPHLDRVNGKNAMYVINTWPLTHESMLAHMKANDKSHEMAALPELQALLNLHGRVVTIDVISGHVQSARLIVAQRCNEASS